MSMRDVGRPVSDKAGLSVLGALLRLINKIEPTTQRRELEVNEHMEKFSQLYAPQNELARVQSVLQNSEHLLGGPTP